MRNIILNKHRRDTDAERCVKKLSYSAIFTFYFFFIRVDMTRDINYCIKNRALLKNLK